MCLSSGHLQLSNWKKIDFPIKVPYAHYSQIIYKAFKWFNYTSLDATR